MYKTRRLNLPNSCLFYYTTIVCILLFGITTINAQEDLTSSTIDSKSYQLYTDNNWSELATFGNEAVQQGYDYFYIRMRTGIAYFEMKNYRLAVVHFKKAIQFNATDDLANEYLYYCYVFTGKSEDARKLSTTFSDELSKKLGIESLSWIDFILLESAIKVTDKSYVYTANQTDYFEPAKYIQLGLKHTVKNRFSMFHALTYFNQNGAFGEVKQKQYYVNASIPLKNEWNISPAIHLVNTNFNGIITIDDTYFVGSLSVGKRLNKFDYILGTTFSNIANANQYNHFGTATYSIFGNSKLIVGFTGYLQTSDGYNTLNGSSMPFVYFQPFKATSVKLSYLKNNSKNIIEDNGSLVNNSNDLTKSRVGVLADYRLNDRFTLHALYQYEAKKYVQTTTSFDYKYNLFLVGLKFSPR